jgi:UDPglucose 6-dehydrogenase
MIKSKFSISNIFFSPEFLRETKALYDNLYPSRIVVGEVNDEATEFANLLLEVSLNDKDQIKVLKMSSKEAEAVKLFSNTFLAMRVSFFNELDSFSEVNSINSEKVINGICTDPRIGNFYNNPSFGYGGYCLPKDTQQLLENFKDIPNEIIKSVIKANATRKKFIVNSILQRNPKNIGIFRLTMKEKSDNFRDSAVLDIIKLLQENNIKIEVYEPMINKINFEVKLNNDLESFKSNADLIIANRNSHLLNDVKKKVYTRDIFNNN